MSFDTLLHTALNENALSLSADKQHALVRYLALLQTWNRAFNLTTITDPRDMVYLHIIDSLLVTPHLQGTRFLDVGSGAGLPGIPLAIMHPHTQWVLLDKNGKKTRFITQAIAELGLTNVQAVQSRCEDYTPTEKFDAIVSRAFGTLALFTDTTQHLLKQTGMFIAMKGKYPQDELDALTSRFTLQNVTRLDLQGLEVERHIVILQNNQ